MECAELYNGLMRTNFTIMHVLASLSLAIDDIKSGQANSEQFVDKVETACAKLNKDIDANIAILEKNRGGCSFKQK